MFSCSIGFNDPKNAIKLFVFSLFIRWSGGHKRFLSKRKNGEEQAEAEVVRSSS